MSRTEERPARPTWPELAGEAIALVAIIAWESPAVQKRVQRHLWAARGAVSTYRASLTAQAQAGAAS